MHILSQYEIIKGIKIDPDCQSLYTNPVTTLCFSTGLHPAGLDAATLPPTALPLIHLSATTAGFTGSWNRALPTDPGTTCQKEYRG